MPSINKDQIIAELTAETAYLRGELQRRLSLHDDYIDTYMRHMHTLRHTTKACEKHKRQKRAQREHITLLRKILDEHQIDWRSILGIEDRKPKRDTTGD